MSEAFDIDSNLGELLEEFTPEMQAALRREFQRGMTRITQHMERSVKESVDRQPWKRTTGTLRDSWRHEFLLRSEDAVVSEVFSESPYAAVRDRDETTIEKKTKPLTVPARGTYLPPGARARDFNLELVPIRKGDMVGLLVEPTTREAVFLLMLSVTQHGTGYIGQAIDDSEGGIDDELNDMIDRVLSVVGD